MDKEKLKSRISWTIVFILALFWVFVTLIPFLFMVMNSFRKQMTCSPRACSISRIPGTSRIIRISCRTDSSGTSSVPSLSWASPWC